MSARWSCCRPDLLPLRGGARSVLFYTPTIFGYAGVSGNSLVPTIYVGATLFVFVLPTVAFVDVAGRKKLFYLGLAGMGSMLVLLGAAFDVGPTSWARAS